MSEMFLLIPGRTSRQGCSLNKGKFDAAYLEETATVRIASADMQRLNLAAGDKVRLTNANGRIDVTVTPAQSDELPPGVLFIAYGDRSSRLMGGETHGSGMPSSKGLQVQLEVLNEQSCRSRSRSNHTDRHG